MSWLSVVAEGISTMMAFIPITLRMTLKLGMRSLDTMPGNGATALGEAPGPWVGVFLDLGIINVMNSQSPKMRPNTTMIGWTPTRRPSVGSSSLIAWNEG